jgi:hypothetical protein
VVAAVISQYRVFALTVVECAFGAGILIADTVTCIVRRTLEPLRRHSLEASWAFGAFVVFGAVQIKFINYFAYVMIPLIIYLWVRIVDVVKPWVSTASTPPFRRLLARVVFTALVVVIVVLDFGSIEQRVYSRQDNTFLAVQSYAAAHIPAHAQVLTEQPIGTMIRQPYCQLTDYTDCPNPRWVIEFTSLTEKPPDDPGLQALVADSTLRATYVGFKEVVTVYEVKPTVPNSPLAPDQIAHRG